MNCLCCGLYNHSVNICFYLLDYLVSIAKKKPDDKRDIVVGGIRDTIRIRYCTDTSIRKIFKNQDMIRL